MGVNAAAGTLSVDGRPAQQRHGPARRRLQVRVQSQLATTKSDYSDAAFTIQ